MLIMSWTVSLSELLFAKFTRYLREKVSVGRKDAITVLTDERLSDELHGFRYELECYSLSNTVQSINVSVRSV